MLSISCFVFVYVLKNKPALVVPLVNESALTTSSDKAAPIVDSVLKPAPVRDFITDKLAPVVPPVDESALTSDTTSSDNPAPFVRSMILPSAWTSRLRSESKSNAQQGRTLTRKRAKLRQV